MAAEWLVRWARTMPLTPLHRRGHEDALRVYAWARYVFWADVEGRQYEAYDRPEDESPLGLGTVLMLQFYAALWVAIEAWRECRMSDDVVDDLLNDSAFDGMWTCYASCGTAYSTINKGC